MKKFDLKKTVAKAKSLDYKKLARDFVYGKPAGERRLGDLYMDKTGLYKHREWRGIKDTFYYFNKVWLYNYGMRRCGPARGTIGAWSTPPSSSSCRCSATT